MGADGLRFSGASLDRPEDADGAFPNALPMPRCPVAGSNTMGKAGQERDEAEEAPPAETKETGEK